MSAAINKAITQGFDTFAEGRAARHPAELNEGLPLERHREPGWAVVCLHLIERDRQQTLLPVWAQANIKMKNSFLLGFNEAQDFLAQTLEVFDVSEHFRAVGLPGSVVDKEKFDIRSIPQFAATELS